MILPRDNMLNHGNLRVMTFNLLSASKKRKTFPWEERREGIVKVFETLQPDVVGTQEANLEQLNDLRDRLPDYEFTGEGNLGPLRSHSDRSWYSAIFYRRETVRRLPMPGASFWLSPQPEQPASRFALASRPRVAAWSLFEHRGSGQPFLFGTTHLEAFMRGHRRHGARLIQEFVSRKLRELGHDVPVFLTGDFNAGADAPEIRDLGRETMERAGLIDAWRHAGHGEDRHGATFRGLDLRDRIGNWLLGHRRIDYVFFRGPQLEVREVERVDFDRLLASRAAPPSDHYPVLAEFSLAS
jgi:endonuclease/exonuclease/phosphatase family metal-dependent hydrolase